ncbi:MAG: cyclic nucleotide-binding domain-containing protein [Cyanobacteria bacterium P01_H01_bin.121]
MAKSAVVSIEGLNYFYGEGSLERQVLYDINLAIKPGEFVILTGPSGSGKSTLLSLIGCLRAIHNGSLVILGEELRDATAEQLVQMRRNLGYITQASNLLDFLTARQNVQMSLELQPELSAQQLLEQSTTILEAVGLAERVNYYPENLSGGQRQRVAIASALVSQPKLILADEPTASLDKVSGRNAIALMQRLAKDQGSAILMVTHDNRILDLADRIINVEDGKLGFALNQEISIALPGFDEALLEQTETKPQGMTYAPGEVIVQQGDAADRFYILLEGFIEIFSEIPNQPLKLLGRKGRGEYFGEVGLLQGGRRTATVKAAHDSEAKVLVISQELFRLMLDNSELTSSDIARRLHQRVMKSQLTRALPNLDPEHLEAITAQVKVLQYGANSNIVQPGDPAQQFYLISEGQVEVVLPAQPGQVASSQILSAGEYFGETELVTGQPYTITVRALPTADVELLVLPKQAFLSLIEGSQTSQVEVASVLQERLLPVDPESGQHTKAKLPHLQPDTAFKPGLLDALLDLNAEILDQAKTPPTIATYQPGDPIIKQGELATTFYLILAGAVEVWQEADGQPPTYIRRKSRGQYFGEIGLLEGITRTATVRAAADSTAEVMVISEDLFRILLTHSELTQMDVVARLQEQILTQHLAPELPKLGFAQIAEIAAQVKVRHYTAGATIVQQGQLADTFYLIAIGEVICHARQDTEHQKQHNGQSNDLSSDSLAQAKHLQAGDYFGAAELIQDSTYPYTMQAATEATVEMLTLSSDRFLKLIFESKLSPGQVASALSHQLVRSKLRINALSDAKR